MSLTRLPRAVNYFARGLAVVFVMQPYLKEGRPGHEAKLSHSGNGSLDINCMVTTLFLYTLSDFYEKQVLHRNFEKNPWLEILSPLGL